MPHNTHTRMASTLHQLFSKAQLCTLPLWESHHLSSILGLSFVPQESPLSVKFLAGNRSHLEAQMKRLYLAGLGKQN